MTYTIHTYTYEIFYKEHYIHYIRTFSLVIEQKAIASHPFNDLKFLLRKVGVSSSESSNSRCALRTVARFWAQQISHQMYVFNDAINLCRNWDEIENLLLASSGRAAVSTSLINHCVCANASVIEFPGQANEARSSQTVVCCKRRYTTRTTQGLAHTSCRPDRVRDVLFPKDRGGSIAEPPHERRLLIGG